MIEPSLSPVVAGTLASLVAGLMTGVGALPLLAMREPSERAQAAMLAFAGGVMLAASMFSLILPAHDIWTEEGIAPLAAWLRVALALALGVAAIVSLRLLPSPDRIGEATMGSDGQERRVMLFVAAIIFHNFPEGLAVGVSFGGDDYAAGLTTALGIGLQNMPEGLAVAAALISVRVRRTKAVAIAFASGMVEPLAGLFGAALVAIVEPALPWALALAAGAMLWVVLTEIAPNIPRERTVRYAAIVAAVSGLVLMSTLDLVFAA